jgi:hypothetical protein
MAFEKNPDDLGALWEKSGGKGPYMTGTINGVKVVCFQNKSDNANAPQWRVMKAKPREDRDDTLPKARAYEQGPPIDDRDIPF